MRVRLEDVCEKESSKLIQSDVIDQNGVYPVYGASGYLGNINTYQQSNYYIAVVKDGAGIGRTMLLPPESSIIGTMQYLIPKDNVLPEYLYYVVKAKHLEKYFSGATIPHIYFKDYKNEQFDLVSFDEQREIINRLKKIEIIIENLSKNLLLLDELVRTRFVEMFGDPVDNPMNWKKKKLKDIVTEDCTISYGIVQTGEEQKEGIPVFRPVDIVNHTPKVEELKKTTEFISNRYKKTLLKGHELLITVRANIADTFIADKEFMGCNVGRGIVPIRTQEDIMHLEFLKCLIDNKHLNDILKSKAKGITLIQLNMEDLRNVELIIPPIDLQIDYLKYSRLIDKSRSRIQKSLEASQELFDSLMQEYFG